MRKIAVYLFVMISGIVFSQKKDKDLPKGNEEFVNKDYVNAEADYRVSQSKSPTKATSSYNLGNSIYRQKQIAEAKTFYLKAIKNAKTLPQKHYAYHNLGNVYMSEKDYTNAVEAYKNALRNNPADEETRYNYALAKEYLKNNPPPKDKKDDKKDKDKKDDKKDEPKKDEPKKDEKKEDKKDGNQDKDKQNKPKPEGISKERLENLLKAVENEEKKIQEKVNGQKVKAQQPPNEKDW